MSDATQLLRHWLLLRTLSARRQGVTLRELADEHDVTPKTILRDLTLLRQLGFRLRETMGEYGRKRWSVDDRGGSDGRGEAHFDSESRGTCATTKLSLNLTTREIDPPCGFTYSSTRAMIPRTLMALVRER